MLAACGDNLDDVTRFQPILERHESVVDLCADAAMPDIGVDQIGEVEWRRAGGQLLHIALRSEHVDLILEDIESDPLKEFRCVRHVTLPLQELAQPGVRICTSRGRPSSATTAVWRLWYRLFFGTAM